MTVRASGVKRLSMQSVRSLLQQAFTGKPCWDRGKYLGSMLYLHFGEKVTEATKRYGLVERGEVHISIRECYWTLYRDECLITDSDTICDETALTLLQAVTTLEDVSKGAGWFNLHFAEGVLLKLDTTDRNEGWGNVVAFFLPDGACVTMTPRGYFYYCDEPYL